MKFKLTFLLCFLFSVGLYAQTYTKYASNLESAMIKLSNKYVRVTLNNDNVYNGYLQLINVRTSNEFVIELSNNENILLKPLEVKDIILRSDIDDSEEFLNRTKAYYTVTAQPLPAGEGYIGFGLTQLFYGGYGLTKNISFEGGFNVNNYYLGSPKLYIQPKISTSFDGDFNLGYIVNFNTNYSRIPYNKQWHMVTAIFGDEKFWVNTGMGAAINQKSNKALFTLSTGIKLGNRLLLIAETFQDKGLLEYYATSVRFNQRNHYFEAGFLYGNRVVSIYNYDIINGTSFRQVNLEKSAYVNFSYCLRINSKNRF